MNIPVEKLSNGTIIQIARELGCNIPCPKIPVNKYFSEIWNKFENGIDITDEFKKKYEEEQERIEKEIDVLFDKYIDNLVEWIYNEYN